jgi:hypothetical protein
LTCWTLSFRSDEDIPPCALFYLPDQPDRIDYLPAIGENPRLRIDG